MSEKTFPEMTFDERVAWAKGHILIAVGEGRYQQAVFTVCHQFTLWPMKKEPVRFPEPVSKKAARKRRK